MFEATRPLKAQRAYSWPELALVNLWVEAVRYSQLEFPSFPGEDGHTGYAFYSCAVIKKKNCKYFKVMLCLFSTGRCKGFLLAIIGL